MKTRVFQMIVLLGGIAFAACTNDRENDFQTINDDGLVIEVGGDDVKTRATYSGFATSFDTNDAIGVYCWNGTTPVAANVKFTKQANGTWSPATKVPYNASYTYYCYFPYRSDHGYTPATSGDADARFSTFIADAGNKFWATNQSTKANFDASNLMVGLGTHVGSGNKVRFPMVHKRALAVFTGEASAATFTGNVPYMISTTGYFLMKPGASTSFTDNTGTYSLSAAAAKYSTHTVSLATDLSMVTNAGGARASMTTANCYLVHATGNYKLPLVYGNAIKNGTVNTASFYPNTTGQLTRFVNHAGTGITGPWITKNGTGVNAGMGLTVASAELLWQDAKSLITAVGIEGDYLTFTVGTFSAGNAVIAVKDGSGTILWSWHIWATSETLESTTAINTGSHTYAVAPVDLGWIPTEEKYGYCPYYQWGRKDPFRPTRDNRSNTNVSVTVYNITNDDLLNSTLIYQRTTSTIADNIKNPTTFYNNTSSGGPCSTTYRNMWDAQNSDQNNVTGATVKTIYDPCPPGFCVPRGNLYCYMANGLDNPAASYTERTDLNWDDTYKGKTWTLNSLNLYFPVNGRRANSSAGTTNNNNQGYYWSATPYTNANGRCLYVISSGWRWYQNAKANGEKIRPVAE